MSLKTSTGLRNGVLATGSLKSLLNGGFIKIYAGTVPSSADDAIGSATLLNTISVNSTGTGINFDTAASAGVLSKAPAEVWSGVNAASGTATFYRHVAAADDGTLSTTQPRIQGTVSTVGADLNLSSVSLTSGATQTIDYYSVALPAL
jgi:hypothetical protein